MAQKAIHWVSGTVSTVGAVAGVIASYDLSNAAASPTGAAWNGCGIHATGTIVGYNTAGTIGAVGSSRIERGFSRVGGVLAVVDAAIVVPAVMLLQAGVLGSVFLLAVNGNLIELSVTGVAGQTIQWFGDMQLRLWQP